MTVDDPDRASLLAHLVAATIAHPEALRRAYAIRSGAATVYLYDGKVTDVAPPAVAAAIEAPLSVLSGVIADGRWLGPFLSGRLRRSGSLFAALELLRAFKR